MHSKVRVGAVVLNIAGLGFVQLSSCSFLAWTLPSDICRSDLRGRSIHFLKEQVHNAN